MFHRYITIVAVHDPGGQRLPLGWPLRHPGPVEGVAFHPSSRWLATTTPDKGVRLWQVPEAVTGTAAEVRLRIQRLTGQELDEYGALRRLGAAAR